MTECIEVAGATVKGGYVQERAEGYSTLAHRVAYARAHGVPVRSLIGTVIRHTCDNPPCINPAHLVAGTASDNMRDMVDRGRDAGRQRRKLQDWQVRSIRQSDQPYKTGRSFGVSNSVTRYILNGTTYKDVV
jgi:hypothetical protein